MSNSKNVLKPNAQKAFFNNKRSKNRSFGVQSSIDEVLRPKFGVSSPIDGVPDVKNEVHDVKFDVLGDQIWGSERQIWGS
jgi:hypothetical protein